MRRLVLLLTLSKRARSWLSTKVTRSFCQVKLEFSVVTWPSSSEKSLLLAKTSRIGLIHGEIEDGNSAVVRELIGVVIESVALALSPLAEEEARTVGEDRVRHAVFPAPGDVLYGVDAETIGTMRLELLHRRLKVGVDSRVFLVQVGQVFERVVLELIAVVKIGNIGIVVKDAIRDRCCKPRQTCHCHRESRIRLHCRGWCGWARSR